MVRYLLASLCNPEAKGNLIQQLMPSSQSIVTATSGHLTDFNDHRHPCWS